MTIYIPDLETNSSLSFAKKLNETSLKEIDNDEKVTLNAEMTWVRPFGMLYTICSIKQMRRKYNDVNFCMHIDYNKKGVSYAAQMGFFKAISKMLLVGKEPGEATGNQNYVPITEIDFDELRKIASNNDGAINTENLIEAPAKKYEACV